MQSIQRWLYYHWLVVLDLWRLRRSFLLHVVIVAGICLPILILGALKRGHVAQLSEDLLKSVTGRQVIAYAAQNGRMLESGDLSDFCRDLPNVDIVLPETFRAVLLRKAGIAEGGHEATVYATLPGDPMLQELGVSGPQDHSDTIVLSRALADKVGLAVGEHVDVVLRRKQAGKADSAIVSFTVSGVFDASSVGGNIGYIHLSAIEDIERYVRGNAVKRWTLPTFAGMSAADRYAGYIVFCRNNDDLRPEDMKTLSDRALDVLPATPSDMELLGRLLKDGFADRLKVYRVMARQTTENRHRRLAITPSDVTALTLAEDDIAIPWNEPFTRNLDGSDYLLLGLSFPERRWLRGEFCEPSLAFVTDAGRTPAEFSVKFPDTLFAADRTAVSLTLSPSVSATLKVLAPPPAEPVGDGAVTDLEPVVVDTNTKPLAVVPAPLLAHLDALERGEATFDPQTETFPPVPIPPNYDKLRIYATSIDGVPAVVEVLREQGYGVTSEFTRIKEIHDQDASLALLVQIVMWGVLLFGIITVSIVLIDSTDRKSKTIGIMRIMGVSSPAVSYMVMLRAAIIGVCAAGIAALFGWVFCEFLSWNPVVQLTAQSEPSWWTTLLKLKPIALAKLDLWQDRAFLVATVGCSVLGSFIPAIKASRLDPFDAIIQSRGG